VKLPSSKFLTFAVAALLAGCGGTQSDSSKTGPEANVSDSAGGASGQASANAPAEATGHPSTDLIARTAFFGNPDRASVQISPDGKHLSWLAESGGVLNVWVAPVSDLLAARAVSKDTKRPVRSYFWAYTGKHILYMQDAGGDENYHVFAVDLSSKETKDLTPYKGVRAQVNKVSRKRPTQIVIGMNDRNPQLHDPYIVDMATGKRTLIEENPGYVGYSFDDSYRLKLASKMRPDGGTTMFKREGKAWKTFMEIDPKDALTTGELGFDKAAKNVYMWDSRGRNTAALTKVNLKSGKSKVIAKHDKADGSGIFVHPTKKTILAASFTYAKREWQVLDRGLKKDFAALTKISEGEPNVSDVTTDMKTWVVTYLKDDGPARYYLYDRKSKKARFLFTNRSELEKLELTKMHPTMVKTRDGLELVNYLSLPLASDRDGDGKPETAQPMVLLVHGGPWARDRWGFNGMHQWLASRGYAVMSVNYRGSTGFGKNFLNAADKEWAGKMHDDLIDTVNYAVENKIANKDKICIMGGSYGGYATLVGLTFTPETFTCGVDIVGPSSLLTLIKSIPPYWKPMQDIFKTRLGDWTTDEGKKMLIERSPLTHVEKIKRPLLIGQGANDPRVKQAESDQIVKAMKDKNIPVSYVLFPDEGHGFHRKANRLAFFAATEAFLSAHLGGKYQPASPDEVKGTTVQVKAGVHGIPGFRSLTGQL